MITASYIAVGAAIRAKTNNFFLGGFLALISHFILDRIPHFRINIKDNKLKPILITGGLFDFSASWSLIYLLFHKFSNAHFIYFGAFMAILSDMISVLKYFLNYPFWNGILIFMIVFKDQNIKFLGQF